MGTPPVATGAASALVEPLSEDHIHLHTPQLPEKALACGEKLRVKDLMKPLPVLSMPLVFAPSLDSDVSAPLAKRAMCLVLCGFPQFVCGSFDTSDWASAIDGSGPFLSDNLFKRV